MGNQALELEFKTELLKKSEAYEKRLKGCEHFYRKRGSGSHVAGTGIAACEYALLQARWWHSSRKAKYLYNKSNLDLVTTPQPNKSK